MVNVGAGTGSYEPPGFVMTAVEPSQEMIAQRPAGAAAVLVGTAEAIPLHPGYADAAMAILSIHHWRDPAVGIAEMRRVARMRIVLLTYDPDRLDWWLSDYAPKIFEEDRRRFPAIDDILEWAEGGAVETLAVPADCSDLFLGALWGRPELVLDPRVRASTSGFARMDGASERAAVQRLQADLESGRWDRRYGHLRTRDTLDVGLRLIVAGA